MEYYEIMDYLQELLRILRSILQFLPVLFVLVVAIIGLIRDRSKGWALILTGNSLLLVSFFFYRIISVLYRHIDITGINIIYTLNDFLINIPSGILIGLGLLFILLHYTKKKNLPETQGE